MNEPNLDFTKVENNIRKRWLFVSVILPVSFFILALSLSIGVLCKDLSWMTLTFVCFAFLFSLFYLEYRCAYKKPGTILLCLNIIFMSLYGLIDGFKIVVTIVELYQSHITIPLSQLLPSLIILLFFTTRLYYSIKLRKINKSMQKKRLLACPVYKEALSVFSTATNFEELDDLFIKLKNSRDWGSGIDTLAKAFSHQKKNLS